MGNVGNKKNLNNVGNKKLESSQFTPQYISSGDLKSLNLSDMQKGILIRLYKKGSKFTIRGCADHLHCDHKNIIYHLNKLSHMGLVEKDGIWKLSFIGEELFEVGNKKLEKLEWGIKKLEKKTGIAQCNVETSSPLRDKAIKRKPPIKGMRLYKVEKETIRLYFQEFMTPEQISDYRGVTLSAVYDTIERIKRKGMWNGPQKNLNSRGGGRGLTRSDNRFRQHAEQIYIKILDKTDSFVKSMAKKGKDIIYDGNITVLYNKDAVTIISKLDFQDKTPLGAQAKSMDFWTKYICSLEQKLKVVLLKPGYNNIRYVKSGEYADTENGIAKSYSNRKERLMVRGSEDGKVWLTTDKSMKRDEFEYMHPDRSLDDAIHLDETFEDLENSFTGVEDTFNDIRDRFDINEPFKPSEIVNILGTVVVQINKFQNNFNVLSNQVKELGASQKISIEMFNNLIKIMSPQDRPQTSTGDDDKFKPSDSSIFM